MPGGAIPSLDYAGLFQNFIPGKGAIPNHISLEPIICRTILKFTPLKVHSKSSFLRGPLQTKVSPKQSGRFLNFLPGEEGLELLQVELLPPGQDVQQVGQLTQHPPPPV